MLFSGSSDGWDADWSSSSKHCLRPIMYSCASLEVGQDESFDSCKHEWKIYSFVHWVVMVFTFVSLKFFVTPVKSIQLFKIDNIISTTDQGINHRCKLKIELETFMFFIWWTPQEISKITTTCNALDDGIRIAHEATVAESCMCTFSLLYCPFIFLLTASSFFDFCFWLPLLHSTSSIWSLVWWHLLFWIFVSGHHQYTPTPPIFVCSPFRHSSYH